MKLNKLKTVFDYSFIFFSGFIYSVSLKYFILPSRVILTGTEGLASALSYFFDSYWVFLVLYIAFQFILLVFALFMVGKVFAFRTFCVVATVVFFLTFLPELEFAQPEPQNERIILVIFGGILSGFAKAISFRHRGSTGDEDIIGAFFASKYLRPVGFISIIAAVVSTSFGLTLNILKDLNFENAVNTLMYTCIYIFVSAETLNNLYRKFQTTMMSIVTNEPDKIGQMIKQTFEHRTFTVQTGSGGFSGKTFRIVKTVMTREEIPVLIEQLKIIDSDSFYYFHDLEGISSKYYISPIR